MTRVSPRMRRCDCHCVQHHGHQRTTYNDDSCGCAITCATQPMTLLAEQRNCALFLDHAADLWFVNQMPGGQWDWSNADQIPEHHDFYDASLVIAYHLRHTTKILHELRRHDPV